MKEEKKKPIGRKHTHTNFGYKKMIIFISKHLFLLFSRLSSLPQLSRPTFASNRAIPEELRPQKQTIFSPKHILAQKRLYFEHKKLLKKENPDYCPNGPKNMW